MMALTFGQKPESPSPVQKKKLSTNSASISSTSSSPTSASSTIAPNTVFHKNSSGNAIKNIFVPKNDSTIRKNEALPLKSNTAVIPIVRASQPLQHTTKLNGSAGSGGSCSSGSDNDGFNTSSSTTTALRRLYFKSGRNSKAKGAASLTSASSNIPLNANSMASSAYHATISGVGGMSGTTASGVPKVIIMGSSSASIPDANINTSTDSASTLITNVTHTDTSETCDSLDLGDNSVHSEPCFSSLEEPLLTALQIDSEYDGTDLELTSCPVYSGVNTLQQDSVESQESCLSIITGESSTTPLLSTHQRLHKPVKAHSQKQSVILEKQRLPNTAPAPTSVTKHFTFDPPQSPKSARTLEKTRNHFTFKDSSYKSYQIEKEQSNKHDDNSWQSHVNDERDRYDNSNNSIRKPRALGKDCKAEERHFYGNGNKTKKLRPKDTNSSVQNRYSTGSTMESNIIRTSPKRERKRSPSTCSSSKVSSAPPTMKESNFFGSAVKLSPTSQHIPKSQRKYSSSSSSGGSERDRMYERSKEKATFPFDREAMDYERIQRECFAVDENSSSSTTTSDSEEGEACSVYERRLSLHHSSPKPADIFQQYTLLSKQEQQQIVHEAVSRPPSRKNSKRIRPDSVMHSTIREHQQFIPPTDAFHPQTKNSSSPGEINKFEDIANKFEQMPPKPHGGSNANLNLNRTCSPNSDNNISNGNSPTGSTHGRTPSPLPDLRIDYFSESLMKPPKRSLKIKTPSSAAQEIWEDCETYRQNSAGHNVSPISSTGSINVTPNPMEVASVGNLPRATIVVQQPSLSLDNTVETLLIKNEGDFVSVEQGKELTVISSARKRHSQQLQHPPHNHLQHSQQTQQSQQQQKRDDNMRQLLDVTNTLTFEELRDFEKRYGSPHHSRSQSVKTPGSRASGRPNQLCLPQQRSRVASMPNTGVEEEYYRLRHFSITGKGIVNRGDSLKSRRSRSNNSVASSNSSNEHLTTTQIPAPNSARNSATCSLASSRESSTSNPGNGPYRVLMLGGPAVGKSSLVSQFMTSEYLHAYDTSIDDDSGEKSVSVLLSGEESELIFIDHSYTEMAPDDCLSNYDPHGFCVIYSASDRSSFTIAEHCLQVLWTNQNIAQKAVILVANKSDLARSRLVTAEEGKAMATAYDCKFIETSVGINHNVDELLVGLLSQIRLKLENPEKSRDLFRKRSIRKSKRRACSPLSGACLSGGGNTPIGPVNNVISDAGTPPGSAHSSPRKYRGSRTSASLKVKGLLGRVWARDSKSKSCENLHVL